jgi:hypothetical protein
LPSVFSDTESHEREESFDAYKRISNLDDLMKILLVNSKDQFNSESLSVFRQASSISSNQDKKEVSCIGGNRVNEQDLLVSLIDTDVWDRCSAGLLPTGNSVMDELTKTELKGEIDENGYLKLDDLDSDGARLVNIAHAIGQKSGVIPIDEKVFLSAMLVQSSSYIGDLIKRKNIDSNSVKKYLKELIDSTSTFSYPLDYEAAEKVLLPTIKLARNSVPNGSKIGEKELFYAFSKVIDPTFKNTLSNKVPSLSFDSIIRNGE